MIPDLFQFWFVPMLVISIFCAGFRKTLTYTESKENARENPDKSNGAPAFIHDIVIKDKMLLWQLGRFLKRLGWYGKPLGSCIYCMPSFYGNLIYWPLILFYNPFDPVLIAFCLLTLASSVFLAGYLYNRIDNRF